MPSINCKCGERLKYGEIPCPIEWLIISDESYDAYSGEIDSESLYRDMINMLKCPKCGSLLVFWNGFQFEPVLYAPSVERILSSLRESGFSKTQSMKTLVDIQGISLKEAKALVHSSKTWSDVYERDEDFQEMLGKSIGDERGT